MLELGQLSLFDECEKGVHYNSHSEVAVVVESPVVESAVVGATVEFTVESVVESMALLLIESVSFIALYASYGT